MHLIILQDRLSLLKQTYDLFIGNPAKEVALKNQTSRT